MKYGNEASIILLRVIPMLGPTTDVHYKPSNDTEKKQSSNCRVLSITNHGCTSTYAAEKENDHSKDLHVLADIDVLDGDGIGHCRNTGNAGRNAMATVTAEVVIIADLLPTLWAEHCARSVARNHHKVHRNEPTNETLRNMTILRFETLASFAFMCRSKMTPSDLFAPDSSKWPVSP